MDPSLGKFSPIGGARKFYNSGKDHNHKQSVRMMGHAHNTPENNLQLVHLLTTNPAAALPTIFPTNGSPQKVFARQSFHVTRPRSGNGSNSWRGSESNRTVIDYEQTLAKCFTMGVMNQKAPLKRQRSFTELYVSKEDLDNKACCIDKEGNFDFEALLPAVYWKQESEREL